MFTLRPRHRLDIRLRDFAYALLAGAWARNPGRLSARLGAGWSPPGEGLACRSVRSGFHLLLESLALPAGSEVLVSAVTHPDMVRILESHGLVAVPVDLDIATLAPRLDLAEQFGDASHRRVPGGAPLWWTSRDEPALRLRQAARPAALGRLRPGVCGRSQRRRWRMCRCTASAH